MNIVLLDGYVDEPSCLGVPPYISPYVRYTAGAISDSGNEYTYFTIDEYRNGSPKVKALRKSNLLVVIGGAIVPGKYLRGTPASIPEMKRIVDDFNGTSVLGGPAARFGFSGDRRTKELEDCFDFISRKDVDAFTYDLLSLKSPQDRIRTENEWRRWVRKGSFVISHHPDFPSPLIIELESFRGCVRYQSGGCLFCTEPLFGEPAFREPKDIVEEVRVLSKIGAVNFRLGAQSCIFSYGAQDIGESETPKPNPKAIEKLFLGIRKAAPNLEVLHTDNANPAMIAHHPDEAGKVLKTLVRTCTSGNVLALGMESADPAVIKANNLNATPDQVFTAVKLINKYGRERGDSGLPRLLPGINILCGLSGETKHTYDLNLKFLKKILESNLLLRRINIRQVAQVRTRFDVKVKHSDFRRFKLGVREEVDGLMLKRIVPPKTIMKRILVEKNEGNTSFGRQVGTYPLLVGIPYRVEMGEIVDVMITDYGQRSVTGFVYPMDVNKATLRALSSLPGIGKRRAARMVLKRPFKSEKEFVSSLDEENVAKDLLQYVSF
jgi:radical SAM superfamily enzyme with C-terminal helix-hairpin-helix motif